MASSNISCLFYLLLGVFIISRHIFPEFWEHQFSCRYPNSSKTPYNIKMGNLCNGTEKLTKDNTVFEDQLQFVSDAVLAFAYAIRLVICCSYKLYFDEGIQNYLEMRFLDSV